MGSGIILGLVIGIVVSGLLITYTNTFDVLKPEIESSVDTVKDTISKVNTNDLIEKTVVISDKIQDVTNKIEIDNPLEPLL